MEEVISKEKAMARLGHTSEQPFQNLTKLVLDGLPKLESIYWAPLPFPVLEYLEIRHCPELRRLPFNFESSIGNQIEMKIEEQWIKVVEWEDEATKQRFSHFNNRDFPQMAEDPKMDGWTSESHPIQNIDLVGTTGSGKSAPTNNIKGKKVVQSGTHATTVTMECQTYGVVTPDGPIGNMINTPGKRKVKEMLFNLKDLKDESRLIGISGMIGSGKTILAKELVRDEEVRGHFGNRVLFLTVSQSPNLEELRALIRDFLTGHEAGFGATLPESIGHTRKLVILDDVRTRESLNQLMFNIPGTTTLVVSQSKLADPRTTYDIELLNEHEATSLFCLSAFNQKSVPSGFSKSLVKQVVGECKGLPLSLKVIGASLKDQPENYWEGAVERLSRGKPVDEIHESKVFAQIEATLENLDPKSKECFLDMGAFPEGKKIPVDVLINMLVEIHDLETATAFDVLVDLANRNLLTLVKDPTYVAMHTSYYDMFVTQHDVLRDVALHLTNRGEVKEMTEMDWFDMDFPKAEVLILNFSSDNYVLPPFIAKMGMLRVFVIINNGISPAHLHDFPISTDLTNLRSLWLERVHVPELSSSMIPLKNLRKLYLIICKINSSFDQTAVDIAQIFPQLTGLTIDYCDDLVELPSTIYGITSLNSISITNCPNIKELPRNISKLKALQLLRLYACPELKSLPVEICELPRLVYVDISHCLSLSFLPEKIGKVKTLEKIDMRECSLSSIPSSAVSLTSLRHVACYREALWMWEEVEKAVPGLRVEATEKWFNMNWPDE
ncbi:unnamed protein product [Arabidopsis arenosa]|uniref:Disease resistance protein n=1 Tax=Arabidopsis arenosa TaxID=38785 RepID=A0A8S2AX34_ARAAE|nr:unnamed protein product [Arabidopsis arenosa]